MAKYVFSDTARYLGRFGFVKPGDVLDLTEQEAASIANSTVIGKVPDANELNIARTAKRITASAALSTSDDGALIDIVKGAGAITVSLPLATGMRAGWNVTLRNSIESTDANFIIIDTVGSELIDGAASIGLELNAARYIYWDGAQFRSRTFSN
jgi:hypothetical protein